MGEVKLTKAQRAKNLTASLRLALDAVDRCRELLINADADADDLAEYDAAAEGLRMTLQDWLYERSSAGREEEDGRPGPRPDHLCVDAQERSQESEISSATPTADLPDVPANPWDATIAQSFAAELRLSRALHAKRLYVRRRDLRQLLHDHGTSQLSDDVVGAVRRAAKEVTGGNCAYTDDDIGVLAHLAMRAIDAGLTDTLSPSIRRSAELAKASRDQSASEQPPDQQVEVTDPGRNPESSTEMEARKNR